MSGGSTVAPVVLVTGGARGIGWATCEAFAAAGFRVGVPRWGSRLT